METQDHVQWQAVVGMVPKPFILLPSILIISHVTIFPVQYYSIAGHKVVLESKTLKVFRKYLVFVSNYR
jgi:hypothetical protein